MPAVNSPAFSQSFETQTPAVIPSSTIPPSQTKTEVVFEIGREITLEYLRDVEITGSEITFEEQLANGANCQQHIEFLNRPIQIHHAIDHISTRQCCARWSSSESTYD